jgi:hypothetical protein
VTVTVLNKLDPDVLALETSLAISWKWRTYNETQDLFPKRIEQLLPKYSPPLLHVLIAIAFVRDNVPLLETLVQNKPPTETVFDDINITERLSKPPTDLDAWTTILTSPWIHRPSSPWHRIGLIDLLIVSITNIQRGDEKKLEKYAKALRTRGIVPNTDEFARAIRTSDSFNTANLKTVFSVFPARNLGPWRNTLIREAAFTGSPTKSEVIRCLVNAGLNVNWIEPKPKRIYPITNRDDAIEDYYGRLDRETPLHTAAARGNLEVVKLLLDFGARSKVRDGRGRTAQERASSNGHVEVVSYLNKRSGWFQGLFWR